MKLYKLNSVVIHGPKMLEPGYEKLSELGISDTVHETDLIFLKL